MMTTIFRDHRRKTKTVPDLCVSALLDRSRQSIPLREVSFLVGGHYRLIPFRSRRAQLP